MSEAGDHALLLRREQVLGPMTLPAATIQLLYDVATDCLSNLTAQQQPEPTAWTCRPLHARIFRHATSLTAVQTQALLPTNVVVQKTTSLMLAGNCLLCTGAGTYRLTRHQLRSLARSLGLSRHAANHVTINAASCSPVEHFGMQPGMVSSFLPPARPGALAALVLLPLPAWCEDHEQTGEIAISLSLWESLLLPLRCFRPLVEEYARRACPTVRFISLESEKRPYEASVTHGYRPATRTATVPEHPIVR